MTETPTAPERVQAAFRKLSATATNLNSASKELSETVVELDAALQRLNLGVSAWVTMSQGADDAGNYWSREIGYTKHANKWGVALRHVTGQYNDPENEGEEVWLFNDAARWMRVEAIGKIPELLEHLNKQAGETTDRIKKKTSEAKELAAAIKAAAIQSEEEEQAAARDAEVLKTLAMINQTLQASNPSKKPAGGKR